MKRCGGEAKSSNGWVVCQRRSHDAPTPKLRISNATVSQSSRDAVVRLASSRSDSLALTELAVTSSIRYLARHCCERSRIRRSGTRGRSLEWLYFPVQLDGRAGDC